MADLSIPNTFVDGATITAAGHNANNDAVETAFNSSIASILSDSSTAGRIIVCNGSGVPQYVTPSGDVDVSNAGVVTLNQTGLAKTGSAAVQSAIAVDATERSTTSSSYVNLGSGFEATVTTTANDILWVLYRGLQKTVGTTGATNTQLQVDGTALSGDLQGVLLSGTYAYKWMISSPTYPSATYSGGLSAGDAAASAPVTPFTPIGVPFGGASDKHLWSAVPIEGLSAGSHTITIKSKTADGTLSVKDRVLRAWVQPF